MHLHIKFCQVQTIFEEVKNLALRPFYTPFGSCEQNRMRKFNPSEIKPTKKKWKGQY